MFCGMMACDHGMFPIYLFVCMCFVRIRASLLCACLFVEQPAATRGGVFFDKRRGSNAPSPFFSVCLV